MTDITQKLPFELLVEIMGLVSIPDVLRLKQVNRTLRDAILAFPLIQHKIDLFAAGLEHNAAAGTGLGDNRKALLQYRSNLDTLCLTEERTKGDTHWEEKDVELSKAVGGIYGITKGDSLQLFSLGSASRGISYKEWKIPSPVDDVAGYAFDPTADVIAFIGLSSDDSTQIEIHLRNLSDGTHHPAARTSSIRYSKRDTRLVSIVSVSITSSRLVVLIKTGKKRNLVVFDWINAQVLYDADSQAYGTVEFIDDYRLLIGLGSEWADSPFSSLSLVDTGNIVEGRPTETLFQLSFGSSDVEPAPHPPSFIMESGVHKPTPAEASAPFYQDPAQRIIALHKHEQTYLVFQVGALLELAKKNERPLIRWKEWKNHVFVPCIEDDYDEPFIDVQVAGCRLFAIYATVPAPACVVEVFDFSMQGQVKYLVERDNGLDVGKFLRPTGAKQDLWSRFLGWRCGHESIVFSFEADEEEFILHIWTF